MIPSRKLISIAICLLCLQYLFAQTPSFELVKPAGSAGLNADFPYVQYGKMYKGFIDFDGDDDLDVLFKSIDAKYFLYENDGVGNFINYGRANFSDYLGGNFIFQSYVFGDFNGDHIQDLISLNENGDDSTKLYLGDETGNYIETTTRFQGGEQCKIISVDIDSDGDLDIVLSSREDYYDPQYKLTIQLNDGSGNFAEGPIALEADWIDMAVTKPFNGNKRNLIIIGGGFTDGLGDARIYHYDGVGNYQLISDTAFTNLHAFNTTVQIEDITGDGKEDILLMRLGGGMKFYQNDNDTTYSYLESSNFEGLGSGNSDFEFVFEDFNQDGNYDIVYNTGTGGTKVYLCDGAGSFSTGDAFPLQSNVESYDCGDLTGDGYPELLIRGYLDDEDFLQLLVNDGDGTFTELKNYVTKEVGNGSIHVADFDSDSDNDLVIFGRQHSSATESDVYLNDGMGALTNYSSLTINDNAPSITGDFNSDGILDILAGNKVYINDGNANFTWTNGYPFSSSATDGDILKFQANNDYAADILFCGEGGVSLYRNNGGGDYESIKNTGLVGYNNAAADAGDLDGDGDQDLVICGILNSGDTVTVVYYNNGDAFFSKLSVSLPAILSGDTKIADLNGDGHQDILLAGNNKQVIYLNDSDGISFTLHQSLEGLSNATLALTDVDFDGDMDFVSTGKPESSFGLAVTKLYLNDGNGNFVDSGIDFRGLQSATVTFGDLDGDYDMDLCLTGDEPVRGVISAFASRVYENTSTINEISKTVKVCDSYYFIDELLTISGNYSKTITTPEGESRIINLALNVGGGYNDTINVTAEGYYIFNGDILRESGIYQATFVSSTGCDSIVTLDLTLTDYVSKDNYEFIAYELIQPDSALQLGADFFPSVAGESQIFDIDGDGDNDYLSIGQIIDNSSNVMGYINLGNGNFKWVDYNISLDKKYAKPTVLHGDLNGDGIHDLIISGERYKSGAADLGTSVYFWNPEKGYVLQDTISIPSSFYGCIGMADFTGDSVNDILVGDYTRKGIYLYQNDGVGNFSDSLITSFLFSWDIAISEPYDGGKRDILIADYVSGFKYVLYRFDGTYFSNTGTTFTAAEGTRAYFADANNDGAPDALISGSSHKIKLYMNDETGAYSYSSNFDNNTTALNQFKFIDLNNDNAAEVIIDKPQYPNNDNLLIYWNDGMGSFSSTDTLEILNNKNGGGYIFSTGDLNDDNYTDLYFNGQDKYKQWRFKGFVNNQSGGFDELIFNQAVNVDQGDAKFEDIDGDEYPDMIVTGDNKIVSPVTEIYSNDGTGRFEKMATQNVDSLKYSSVAFADIDGNSTKDLVIMGRNASDSVITKLYINTGGVFSESGQILNDVADGTVTFLNANKDEFPDLITMGIDSMEIPQVFLYLNDGFGNFSEVESGIDGLKNGAISIGDVNGDSQEDILLTGLDAYDYNSTALYLSNGDGTFVLDLSNVLVTANDAHIIDVDGDNDKDIYLAGTGVQYIYINDGSGHFSLRHKLDNIWKSKAQFDDIDLDGDMDIVVSGQWEIYNNSTRTCMYINDGNGNFTLSEGNLLHSVYNGSLHVVDIDGDYDNDLVLTGTVNGTTNTTRVYRNITCSPGNAHIYASSCRGYDFYGDTISETGVYYHDITTLDGCNRTLALHFTFTGNETVIDTTVCDSIEFNGEILKTSGQYKAFYSNHQGCDSVVILNLTILEPTYYTDVITACGNYTWLDGITYTENNHTATYVLTSEGGCDSVVILDLTILAASTGTDVITSCESYTWIDGITYSKSNNQATYTLTNAAGCDSIVKLDLTIADTCANTSVTVMSNNDILVYPNPVHDYLVIELPSVEYKRIEILDVAGKVVLTKNIEGDEVVISNLKLESGTYILRILGNEQSINSYLLIKD